MPVISGAIVNQETIDQLRKMTEAEIQQFRRDHADYIGLIRAADVELDRRGSTRFKIGDRVRVLPHTDAFMQGFTYGVVSSVNHARNTVYVRWEMNRAIRKRFHPSALELA